MAHHMQQWSGEALSGILVGIGEGIPGQTDGGGRMEGVLGDRRNVSRCKVHTGC